MVFKIHLLIKTFNMVHIRVFCMSKPELRRPLIPKVVPNSAAKIVIFKNAFF
jgi:hypothetical protein